MVQMTLLLLLSSTTVALASFLPDVRIDHEYNPTHECRDCAIAIGPGAPSSQPIYVVFEDDSTVGPFRVRTDVMFQKSTDAGRTWLPTDLLIQRGDPFANEPDITTDSDGNVYIVYAYHDTAVGGSTQVSCVRSSDGGATWSAPARVHDESVGLLSMGADSAGNLFVAWIQVQPPNTHVFTSVSTDKGATWSPRVRVDNDTLTDESNHADVFVQPGTNHYLVAATTWRLFEGQYVPCAFLYRSTDRGQTFEPGVQLDTFNWDAFDPHVVADRDHIVCNYFGSSRAVRDTMVVEARTFYTEADSWGSPVRITKLDSLHELYYSGPLAISGDGRVHTALMIQDTADSRYNIYYTSSSDHGVSWSDLELVTDDTTVNSYYPDIGADIAGYAYVVWYEFDGALGTEWFTTNSPAGIAEETPNAKLRTPKGSPSVVRGVLVLAERPSTSASSLLDISGREVMDLKPGTNDVRALAPGVYFIREGLGIRGEGLGKTQKVVVTR